MQHASTHNHRQTTIEDDNIHKVKHHQRTETVDIEPHTDCKPYSAMLYGNDTDTIGRR